MRFLRHQDKLAKQIEMVGTLRPVPEAPTKNGHGISRRRGKLEKVRPVAECPLVLWWESAEDPSLYLVKDKRIRVAIADPEVAPYGALAKEYL
jgi:hypothetical protein